MVQYDLFYFSQRFSVRNGFEGFVSTAVPVEEPGEPPRSIAVRDWTHALLFRSTHAMVELWSPHGKCFSVAQFDPSEIRHGFIVGWHRMSDVAEPPGIHIYPVSRLGNVDAFP